MRIIVFLFLIILTLDSTAQVITDSLSLERDVVFYKMKCGTTELSLKRVLIQGESASIRKGRELLVATNERGNIVYEFKDIDNYSSLYFEVASFNVLDINSDGSKELIIEIEPFESKNTVWIYQLHGCEPEFIESLKVDEYEIRANELVTKKNAICSYWDECIEYASFLSRVDYEKLTRVDFYSIKNDHLINTNSEHQNTIDRCKDDYKIVIEQFEDLKSESEQEWEREQITEMQNQLNKLIEDYSYKNTMNTKE